jgi:hypothetical protein
MPVDVLVDPILSQVRVDYDPVLFWLILTIQSKNSTNCQDESRCQTI